MTKNFSVRNEDKLMKRALTTKFSNSKQPTKRLKPVNVGDRARQARNKNIGNRLQQKLAREVSLEKDGVSCSPEVQITSRDLKEFENEVIPSYGITSSYDPDTPDKVLQREKKRLLCEIRLPLNFSESKIVCVGLDPFLGFEPVVRILKSGVELGVNLTRRSYEEFTRKLSCIVDGLKSDTVSTTYFEDYKVSSLPGRDMCKFTHVDHDGFKREGTFEMYIMSHSLETLFKMHEFVLKKLHIIATEVCNFKGFCDDVLKILGVECEDEDDAVNHLLTSKYQDDYLLQELHFKFPNFVICEIKRLGAIYQQNT